MKKEKTLRHHTRDTTHAIILAAGKGSRMQSELPKVLHTAGEITLIDHVLTQLSPLCAYPTLVIGHGGEAVLAATHNRHQYVWQHEQKGTGHAVAVTKDALTTPDYAHIEEIIVAPGDQPLVRTETIARLAQEHRANTAPISLVSLMLPHFNETLEHNYSVYLHHGRIVRNRAGDITGIVEYKDATKDERALTEVNLSYYCFDAAWLWQHIDTLKNANTQGEYYLTDLIADARANNETIHAITITNPTEGLGVNTPEQLAVVEAQLQSV